ncbi:MAG: DUF1284 domain-containing protein [Methanomassiliicoccales archaeon]|nr:DUF1284 domain-containing protein [Methanomassiliicoccales archaeon]
MKQVRLRHHHLVCMQNFVGKGYDENFVANMQRVIEDLRRPDTIAHLEIGCDDICSCCPNRDGALCRDETSVIGKDRSVALFLGIPERTDVDASAVLDRVKERMLELDDVRSLCGECDWADLCNERIIARRNGK